MILRYSMLLDYPYSTMELSIWLYQVANTTHYTEV